MTYRTILRRLGPLSACLALFAVAGCIEIGGSSSDKDEDEEECKDDLDCNNGQFCDDGECVLVGGGGTGSGGAAPRGGTGSGALGGTGPAGTGGTAGTTATCTSLCEWSVRCGHSTASECGPTCDGIYATGGACRTALDSYTQCIRTNSTNCNAGMTTGPCYSLGTAFVEACSSSSCVYTLDGECDEPEGTGLCPEGTDVVDCSSTCVEGSAGNTCVWACDAECDEPDLCAPGTDAYDCGGGV